jgi:predicted  nucleic acid-binding Zn-ribbon protein
VFSSKKKEREQLRAAVEEKDEEILDLQEQLQALKSDNQTVQDHIEKIRGGNT